MTRRKALPLKRGPGPKRTPHQSGVCPRCNKPRLAATDERRESFGEPHVVWKCSSRRCGYDELRPE